MPKVGIVMCFSQLSSCSPKYNDGVDVIRFEHASYRGTSPKTEALPRTGTDGKAECKYTRSCMVLSAVRSRTVGSSVFRSAREKCSWRVSAMTCPMGRAGGECVMASFSCHAPSERLGMAPLRLMRAQSAWSGIASPATRPTIWKRSASNQTRSCRSVRFTLTFGRTNGDASGRWSTTDGGEEKAALEAEADSGDAGRSVDILP